MIYFLQPTDGGLIKIGRTKDIEQRIVSFQFGYPKGVEVLATFEGGAATEMFMHCCFQPIHNGNEWFNSNPALWELIVEVLQSGKPKWIDVDENTKPDELRAQCEALFGGVAQASAALGYQSNAVGQVLSNCHFNAGPVLGKLAFHKAKIAGFLPRLIRQLHETESFDFRKLKLVSEKQ